jgi:hypothetical protein
MHMDCYVHAIITNNVLKKQSFWLLSIPKTCTYIVFFLKVGFVSKKDNLNNKIQVQVLGFNNKKVIHNIQIQI